MPGTHLRAASAAIVAVLIGSACNAAPAAPELRTAVVARGSVTQTVSVSGSVNASGQVRLNFKTAGRLAEIYVAAGQQVTPGQPLGRLDTTDLIVALNQAQANVAAAQASYERTIAGASGEDLAIARQSVDNAQKSLGETQKTTQNDVQSAQQTLSKAQTNYVAAKNNFTILSQAVQSDVRTYQAGIATAQSQLTQAQSDLGAVTQTSDVRSAQNSLNLAQAALANAASFSTGVLSGALSDYGNAASALSATFGTFDAQLAAGVDTSAASAAYQLAQTAYATAASRLANAIDAPNGQLASAQTNVTAAQNSLSTTASKNDTNLDQSRNDLQALQNTLTTEQQLASATKAKIAQAGTSVGTITDAVTGTLVSSLQGVAATQERTTSTLLSAQNSLQSAQLSLQKTAASAKSFDIAASYASVLAQQANLESAQNNLLNATLKAPSAGVVASVSGQIGEFVSGGGVTNPFILLADTTGVALHGTIGEADVAKLRLGQVATLTVDAVGTGRMTGKVSALDPIATIAQGVPVYGIDVLIDIPNPQLRPGMSGTAAIIIASRQNVLTVPNLAVRTANGRRSVQLLKDGQAVDTDVTFGISNETVTEVTTGLQEGDTVVLPQPRAAASGAGGVRIGGGPPGAGR
ncbi:MAG: hypothetical protein NVS9B6_01450 [Candidatus Limnocylindrales bacterium]